MFEESIERRDSSARPGPSTQDADAFRRLCWLQGFLVGSVLVLGALGVFLAVIAHR